METSGITIVLTIVTCVKYCSLRAFIKVELIWGVFGERAVNTNVIQSLLYVQRVTTIE